MSPDNHEVTELLNAWSEGDVGARDQLMTLVYQELQGEVGSKPASPATDWVPRAQHAFERLDAALAQFLEGGETCGLTNLTQTLVLLDLD